VTRLDPELSSTDPALVDCVVEEVARVEVVHVDQGGLIGVVLCTSDDLEQE